MKKVLLVVCMVALIVMASVGAYASSSVWLMTVKALNTGFAAGGAAVTLGVGAPSTSSGAWPTTAGSTAQAEKTGTDTAYHGKHIVAVDPDPVDQYAWDLKIGARTDATYSTINICLYNNIQTALGADQQIDLALGYSFFDGTELAAWFSTVAKKDGFAAQQGYTAPADLNKWVDVSALLQAKGWNPTAGMNGWYYQDTVTKGSDFDGLGSYSLQAYGEEPVVTPEPGSLMALGSGLIGLAGFAIRRRR